MSTNFCLDRRSGGNKDGQQQSRQGSSQTGQPRPRQQSHQFEGNLENSASFPAMGQQFPRGDSTTWRQAQPPPLQQLSPPSFFQQSAQQQSGSQKKTPQKESSEKLVYTFLKIKKLLGLKSIIII